MHKQDISYWNSETGVNQYKNGLQSLFDVEKVFLLDAVWQLKKPFQKIKILDVGCGTGRTTKVLMQLGCTVQAIDIAPNLVKEAERVIGKGRVTVDDAANLRFKSNIFDIVLFSHNGIDYLYPYKKRQMAFREITRVLKKGGFFIFSSHIFCPIPFNRMTLKNVIRNFIDISKLLSHGYYHEQLGKQEVITYSARSREYIHNELKIHKLRIVRDTKQIEIGKVGIRNYLRAILSWERYYIAQKQ